MSAAVVAAVETITVDKAKALLDNNKKNRPINDNNLNAIIMEMNRNNFHLTGESIKVARDGTLLDGQHRLMAIVKTRKPLRILVVRGLDNDAFKYIDTGRTRKASDVLAIEGVSNSTKMAAIAKFIINFKKGYFHNVANRTQRNTRITNADISEFVAKNGESLQKSYPYGYNKDNKGIISGTTLAAMHFILKAINEDQADEFCEKITSGENLSKESPIYLLRQKLISDVRAKHKMPAIEKLALICKAWLLFRSGKKVSILKWDNVREPFPDVSKKSAA